MWVQFLGLEDPLEEGMAVHSSTLPGEPHGQRSLAGHSPWGHNESDMTAEISRQHVFFVFTLNICPQVV